MKHYWLRLYPEQPLHLDDPVLIPGRAVRGAVAAVLLRGCIPGDLHDDGPCSPACQFWPLFGARTLIRFGDAHTTAADDAAPFLLTARTCSVRPGFVSGGQHGVIDTLVRGWLFEEAAGTAAIFAPFEMRCAVCGAELRYCEGLLARHTDRHYGEVGIPTTLIRTEHRPVNRSHRAGLDAFEQSGALLARSACYAARLTVPDSLDAPLRAVLNKGLTIGGRRTRGMGMVRAELVPRPDPTHSLQERIAAFNRALRAENRFYTTMGVEPLPDDGSWYFTLDFPAGIILNTARQPSLLAEVKALRNVRIMRQWLRSGISNGRNTATGMLTPGHLVFAGVILCRVLPEEDRMMLEQALAYLETHGLGTDRDRGYGEVTVCDPFHLELEPL